MNGEPASGNAGDTAAPGAVTLTAGEAQTAIEAIGDALQHLYRLSLTPCCLNSRGGAPCAEHGAYLFRREGYEHLRKRLTEALAGARHEGDGAQ